MAKVVAYKEFSINEGDLYNADVRTCSAISGSGAYEFAFFRVSCVVALVLFDNDNVYFGVRSGKIDSQDPQLIHGVNSRWPAWSCHDPSRETWSSGGWPEGRYQEWNDVDGTRGVQGAYQSASVKYPCNALSIGDDSSQMVNWQYAAKVDDLRDSSNPGYVNYYFGIPVHNNSGSASSTNVSMRNIRAYWPEVFDYFPWARYQTLDGESTYWSHNRKSPNTGSLQRVAESKWTDVKNQMPEGTASNKDKGFRHDGTKFVKSPKLGKNK